MVGGVAGIGLLCERNSVTLLVVLYHLAAQIDTPYLEKYFGL